LQRNNNLSTSVINAAIHKKIDLYLSYLNFLKQIVMEEKTTSIWKSSLVSAIYLAIALILLSVIFYVMGNPFSKVSQYLTYPIMIAGIIWAQISYKKALDGTLTYGQAVGVGVLTLTFAGVITGLYTFLLYQVIDPSLQEQLRIYTEEQIIQQGRVPEEQLEMAVNMAAKFQTPAIMFGMAVVGGAFVGLIISLITAIFIKKNPSDEVPL
jgi:hypothetical protein